MVVEPGTAPTPSHKQCRILVGQRGRAAGAGHQALWQESCQDPFLLPPDQGREGHLVTHQNPQQQPRGTKQHQGEPLTAWMAWWVTDRCVRVVQPDAADEMVHQHMDGGLDARLGKLPKTILVPNSQKGLQTWLA
jgi:hypothetical protein